MVENIFEKWALHAYADGQIGDEEKRAVEQILANNDEVKNTLSEIQRQKAELHKAYDSVLDEDIPASILKAAQGVKQAPFWPRLALAASLSALVIGAGAGWFAHNYVGQQAMAESLAQRSLDAFEIYGVDQRHPVEVAATESEHLKTWLSNRLGVKFNIPDLAPQGFTLVGGRLLVESGKPAGLLMYEDADKKRMSIYIAANDEKSNSSMIVEHRGKLVTCYWVEPDMVYALAGEQSSDMMLKLAQAAHEGFDKEG
jgi:anti-sigma factor RsiW